MEPSGAPGASGDWQGLDGEELLEVITPLPLSWRSHSEQCSGPERERFFALIRQLASLVIEISLLAGHREEVEGRIRRVLEWRRQRAASWEGYEVGLGDAVTGLLRHRHERAALAETLAAFRREADPLAGGGRRTSIAALAEAFERQAVAEEERFDASPWRFPISEAVRAIDDIDRERLSQAHPSFGTLGWDWYDPTRHDDYPHDEIVAVYRYERRLFPGGPGRAGGLRQWHAWAKEEARRHRERARRRVAPRAQ